MASAIKGLLVWVIVLAVSAAGKAIARTGIANTAHNLSATSPGTMRAASVARICVFCHTPHNANPTGALWNQAVPGTTYKLYESSTLEATLSQPTGESRLCLSCHDGTMAMGNLRVRPRSGGAAMSRLIGRASLGTDLSDDHPISFVYDSDLATRHGELVDPVTLVQDIRLDKTNQLQCTACHDAHDAGPRKFLQRDNRSATLCTVCHRLRNWTGSAHATSAATWRGGGTKPLLDSPFVTVAENGCGNCHRSHAAPRPERLLNNAQERDVCLVCHDRRVASKDIGSEFLKSSAHPIASSDWTHDPLEDPYGMPRHVTCTDCHNPHQAWSVQASPPVAPGPLRGVRGVNISGGPVSEAIYEYEVCLKCHGILDETTIGIVRQDNIRNTLLEITPGNTSYHPVASVGRNPTVLGFEPGYSATSIIYCTDCHNNDEWRKGGVRPRGPHGSRYHPVLEREYRVNDPNPESYQTYNLCYKCHNRTFLINDQANTFPHNKHVVTAQSPCAACHDAHGSRQNAHLINFMRNDRTAKPVVTPSSSGRLEYIWLGPGSGQCYLMCHGKDHDPEQY